MLAVGIIVATLVAFIISAVLYGTTAAAMPPDPHAPARPMVATVVVELARNAAVACLVAGLISTADWRSFGAGITLGLALSIIPVSLLAGSVFHEGVPVAGAALHALDWIVKLAAISVTIAVLV